MRYSLCGMLSVNNAMQQPDLLTQAKMEPILKLLRKAEPKADHGCVKYGGYSMHALHLALQQEGYELHWVTKTGRFRCAKKLRGERIVESRHPRMLVIGRRPGQAKRTFHCIGRANVAGSLTFIDSDEYRYFENDVATLNGFFEHIDGIYRIEAIAKKQK